MKPQLPQTQPKLPWQEPEALALLQGMLASPVWPVLRQFLDYRIAQTCSPIHPSVPVQGEWAILRAFQDGGHYELKGMIVQLENLAKKKMSE